MPGRRPRRARGAPKASEQLFGAQPGPRLGRTRPRSRSSIARQSSRLLLRQCRFTRYRDRHGDPDGDRGAWVDGTAAGRHGRTSCRTADHPAGFIAGAGQRLGDRYLVVPGLRGRSRYQHGRDDLRLDAVAGHSSPDERHRRRAGGRDVRVAELLHDPGARPGERAGVHSRSFSPGLGCRKRSRTGSRHQPSCMADATRLRSRGHWQQRHHQRQSPRCRRRGSGRIPRSFRAAPARIRGVAAARSASAPGGTGQPPLQPEHRLGTHSRPVDARHEPGPRQRRCVVDHGRHRGT